MTSQPSTNFAFLAHHDPRLVALGTQAEAHFAGDPVVAIIKLRQFGEVLAKRAAAKVGLLVNPEDAQQQTIVRLWERGVIGATQRSLTEASRRSLAWGRSGNAATSTSMLSVRTVCRGGGAYDTMRGLWESPSSSKRRAGIHLCLRFARQMGSFGRSGWFSPQQR